MLTSVGLGAFHEPVMEGVGSNGVADAATAKDARRIAASMTDIDERGITVRKS